MRSLHFGSAEVAVVVLPTVGPVVVKAFGLVVVPVIASDVPVVELLVEPVVRVVLVDDVFAEPLSEPLAEPLAEPLTEPLEVVDDGLLEVLLLIALGCFAVSLLLLVVCANAGMARAAASATVLMN